MSAPDLNHQIADLLFPQVHQTPEDLFRQYPPRELPEGAIVTRFGPSPTGFVHIGTIYGSLIGRTIARQSGGVWLLRIEDTDQQREIVRGVEQIVESLAEFGIIPDEGPYSIDPVQDRGRYGPYAQSQRRPIYAVFAKYMVARGAAYPSFQTSAEIDAIRAEQERTGNKTGYYGPWAKDRGLTLEDIQNHLREGRPFVIRYRALYPARGIIRVQDAIRGPLEMPANDQDYVLLKIGWPAYLPLCSFR